MGRLLDSIRQAVAADRVLVSDHADERTRERGAPVWQVVVGLAHSRLITERPNTRPNPTIEVAQTLADGTPIKVVWAYSSERAVAILVTVHIMMD